MKLQKLTVGLFLFAGVLFLIGGLRDIFAPGFFNVSPQVKSRTDTVFQFVSAATFLAVAYLFTLNQRPDENKKK